VVADFQPGFDRILFAGGFVGDGDMMIEGAVTADAAGNFSAAAEVVFFPTPLANPLLDNPATGLVPILATDVVAVIGDASAPLAPDALRLLVLTDGSHAAFFVAQSIDGNATIGADELYLWAVVANLAAPDLGDFALI
jgi:hypothetical protein